MPAVAIIFCNRSCIKQFFVLLRVIRGSHSPVIKAFHELHELHEKYEHLLIYWVPPARSWKSSTLGNSVKSFNPNCIRNSLEVPYIMGRPTVSFLPFATINFLSSNVLIDE